MTLEPAGGQRDEADVLWHECPAWRRALSGPGPGISAGGPGMEQAGAAACHTAQSSNPIQSSHPHVRQPPAQRSRNGVQRWRWRRRRRQRQQQAGDSGGGGARSGGGRSDRSSSRRRTCGHEPRNGSYVFFMHGHVRRPCFDRGQRDHNVQRRAWAAVRQRGVAGCRGGGGGGGQAASAGAGGAREVRLTGSIGFVRPASGAGPLLRLQPAAACSADVALCRRCRPPLCQRRSSHPSCTMRLACKAGALTSALREASPRWQPETLLLPFHWQALPL